MANMILLQPASLIGPDGWTEVGGGTQPPNRVLPAPIFDVGNQYQPNNGATGTWIIEKNVFSPVSGAGSLTIPAGAFPSGGGVFSDDNATISVNGVTVPFAGTGTGVIAPGTQPVNFVAGNNVVRVVVGNTIAGGTAVTGRLDAVTPVPTLPCDCCNPDIGCRVVVAELLLDAPEAIITNGTGAPILPLSRWSDGDLTGANFTGWTSPAGQWTALTSPTIDLSFTVPHNGITGIREWNQGGGDLGDFDGFLSWDYEVFAGAVSLATGNMVMGNGGAPFTHNFPGGALNGVTRIRLSNMRKLSAGTVSPLVREVRLLQTTQQTVFRCRDAQNGAVTWYDIDGNLVANSQVVATTCPNIPGVVPTMTAVAPYVPEPTLRLSTSFMGDDGGTGENLCNVVPAPTSVSGFTLVGACYDPVPNAFMDWTPATSSVQVTYDSHGSVSSGASLFNFNLPGNFFYTWAANATPMVPGEQRVSQVAADGSFLRVTQLPFTGPAVGALRMDGAQNLRIGPAFLADFGNYPMFFEVLR